MEVFDIVNEQGRPTGKTVDRTTAHEQGILHRTSHVWLVRNKNEKKEILLQKRCMEKDSFPGHWDISSAGHIPAGFEFKESAVRELKEELGIDLSEDDLILCGQRHFQYESNFHGKAFKDNQISNVYMAWYDCEPESLQLQKEEVEAVQWMELEDCIKAVKEHTIKHCIYLEELYMIRNQLE